MKRFIQYILIVIPVLVFGQSDSLNYVKNVTYKIPTINPFASPNPEDAAVNVTYFDGLGRPIQQIAHKQSDSGKDIVTHIEYDEYGRQIREYLPYASNQSSMNYLTTAQGDVITYYDTHFDDSFPFSEKKLENSPLGRVLKQGAPGYPWQLASVGNDQSIKFSYETNVSNEVKYFYVTTSSTPNSYGVYTISLSNSSGNTYYNDNQLYKTVITDENGSKTAEYKDKEGRVVLKRANYGVNNHDTYYVYDKYGNLTYVIPPKAVDMGTINPNVLNNLCYQYVYDSRNRLVEKKLPGKRWEYIVYDKLDRVVATGPALSPFSDVSSTGWLVTKYDVFGRVAYTGWNEVSGSFESTTRNSLQNSVNSMSNLFVTKQNSTIDGVAIGYSNNSTLPAITKLLTVNYYDNYSYPGAPPTPAPNEEIEGQAVATNVKGLATGSWVRVSSTTIDKLNELSYTMYDLKARPIRTYQKNHLGGFTKVDTELDFTGTPIKSITTHKYDGSISSLTTITEEFDYSDQGRLREHTHRINSGTVETLSYNEYDELGQLKKKKVGRTSSAPLQEVDYQYNIRGWLTDINNVESLGIDLFAFKINYDMTNHPLHNGPGKPIIKYFPMYNGNIAETYWRTSTDNVLRKYGYSYDELNRLKDAYYMKPSEVDDKSSFKNNYNESLTYDKNGNILTLYRTGDLDSNIDVIEIDDLVYNYDNGNILVKVTDDSNHPEGFTDGVDITKEYYYDDFGNMVIDHNKGIVDIRYNHLNLPTMVLFASDYYITYIYTALGQKVKKVINGPIMKTTDYLGGFHYENTELKFFATAEGYVNVVLARGNYKYNYVYNYTDHLGNIRLSYTKGFLKGVEVLEENHYYPFGLKHQKYGSTQKDLVKVEEGEDYYVGIEIVPPGERKAYQYKYNGKEFQDELGLNFYDYGARNYAPALGRWMNIDPLAEQMRRHSPYNYAFNNPVYFIDPDGMKPSDWYKNLITGKISWKKGSGIKFGYRNLGYTFGSTDVNGNRLLMDGDSKQITYNGIVIYDYNKNPNGTLGGFALADGGNNQNPSELRKGGRDAQWVDFKGLLGLLDLLLGRQPGKVTNPKGSVDKGTNGGAPTMFDKVNDGVDAVISGTSAVEEVTEATNEANKKEGDPVSSEGVEFVLTAYDPKTGNSTYVRRDIYEARNKKNNNEN